MESSPSARILMIYAKDSVSKCFQKQFKFYCIDCTLFGHAKEWIRYSRTWNNTWNISSMPAADKIHGAMEGLKLQNPCLLILESDSCLLTASIKRMPLNICGRPLSKAHTPVRATPAQQRRRTPVGWVCTRAGKSAKFCKCFDTVFTEPETESIRDSNEATCAIWEAMIFGS